MEQKHAENYIYLLKKAMGNQTLNDFAARAGLSPGNLSRIMRGQPARPQTLGQIAAASHSVSYEELMVAAGYMQPGMSLLRGDGNSGDSMTHLPLVRELHGSGQKFLNNKNLETIAFPSALLGSGTYFLFKATDNGFAPKLREGDILLVDRDRKPEDGEIAVLLCDKNEALVRRLQHDGSRCQLYCDNPAFPPRSERTSSLVIYGTAVRALVSL